MSLSLRMAANAAHNAGSTSRLQVISMYRQLLRTAATIPSYNHRGHALQKARASFRANAGLTDANQINFALQLAETQLDNLKAQVTHMKEIMNMNTLTHNAPKPARLHFPSTTSSTPSRSFSTTRSLAAAEPAAATVATPSLSLNTAAPTSAASFWGTGARAGAAGEEGVAAPQVTASHIVHVLLSPNNTIVTLTTLDGNTKAWASSGTAGFKNAKKSTYMACIAAGEQLGQKARNQNILNVDMQISGFHKNKKAVLKGLMKAGLNIVAIRDTTPIPFNGCKPKKMRRL